MGKQEWFRSKSFYIALLCISTAITAVTVIIAQYVNNGHQNGGEAAKESEV